jgi:hypothetical protein
MTDHKNIQEAMLAIYKSVGYVQKTKSENLSYKFASETGFIQEIRPAMVENGVTVSVSKMDNLTQESYTTKSGAVMMRSTIHGVVTFSHVSGSSISVESYGEGSDSGDKSVNKAMTDLYKYALRQTFMIETGDDPDKDASEPVAGQKAPEKKPTGKLVIPDKPTISDYWQITRMQLKWTEQKAKELLVDCENNHEKAIQEILKSMEAK